MGQALPIISAVVSAVGTAYAANEQQKAQLQSASQNAAQRREGSVPSTAATSQRFAAPPGGSSPVAGPADRALVPPTKSGQGSIDLTATYGDMPVNATQGTPHQVGMRDANATARADLAQPQSVPPVAQQRQPATLGQAVGPVQAPPPQPRTFSGQPTLTTQAPQQGSGGPTLADILRMLQARSGAGGRAV